MNTESATNSDRIRYAADADDWDPHQPDDDDNGGSRNGVEGWVGAFERVGSEAVEGYGAGRGKEKGAISNPSRPSEAPDEEEESDNSMLSSSVDAGVLGGVSALTSTTEWDRGGLHTLDLASVDNPGCLTTTSTTATGFHDGESFVSVSCLPSCLFVFDRAYVNGLPSLQAFRVKNLKDDQSVLVQLDSSLGDMLDFRIYRENAAVGRGVPDFPVDVPTNTELSAATFGPLHRERHRSYSALLASLRQARSLLLKPREEQLVYAAFTPVGSSDNRGRRRDTSSMSRSMSASWTEASQRPISIQYLPEHVLQAPAMTTTQSTPATSTPSGSSSPLSESSRSMQAPLPVPEVANVDVEQVMLKTGASISPPASQTSATSMPAVPRDVSASSKTDRRRRLREVRGLVTLYARTLDYGAEDWLQRRDDSEFSLPSSDTSSRRSSIYSASPFDPAGTLPHLRDTGAQTIVIPVHASACQSALATSLQPSSTLRMQRAENKGRDEDGVVTIDLGDCLLGKSAFCDFVISNESDIDLYYMPEIAEEDASFAGTDSGLSITNMDTGETRRLPWHAGHVGPQADDDLRSDDLYPAPLGAFAKRNVRLYFRPQDSTADLDRFLTLRNLNDPSNSVKIRLRATVLSAPRDDSLKVVSGHSLDFGDCCGGQWARQLIVLKNTGDVLLDVAFSAEKATDVLFQLAEAGGSTEGAYEPTDESLPPPSELSAPSGRNSPALSGDVLPFEARPASFERPASESQSVAGSSDMPHRTAAAELARTPTHHASAATSAQPPTFSLDSSVPDMASGAVKQEEADVQDADVSSVASQAGSETSWSPSRSQAPKVPEEVSNMKPRPTFIALLNEERDGRKLPSGHSSGPPAPSQQPLGGPPSSKVSSGWPSRPPSRGAVSQAESTGLGQEDSESRDDSASMRSELVASSMVTQSSSNLGPFGPSTSAMSTSGPSPRAQTMSRKPRSSEQAQNSQLEELVLRPGGEYRIIVSWRPTRGTMEDSPPSNKLSKVTFKVFLDYARAGSAASRTKGGRERKVIACKARTCTSFVSVSPTKIDFGDANIGARKTSILRVTNLSELTARVDLRFVSKVISTYRDEIAIPPVQTVELKVDLFPRRVNETYRKQITVVNLLNRSDDQIVEIQSRNVDKQRVSFHSLFYRILTPTGANFIDFGDVNINSSSVRTFTIENMTQKRLLLDVSAAHPEDVVLYCKPHRTVDREGSSADQSSDGLESQAQSKSQASNPADAPSTKAPSDVFGKEVVVVKPKVKVNGSALKERFLESIANDSRGREESSNRRTGKASQSKERTSGKDIAASKAADGATATSTKSKPSVNVAAALKKGGKGRITQPYGKAVAFKDRTLLSSSEYLDLATGPPLDPRRTSPRSKRQLLLDSIETKQRPKSAAGPKSQRLSFGTSSSKGAKKDRQQGTPKISSPLVNELGSTSEVMTPVASRLQSSEAEPLKAGTNRSPALTGKRKARVVLSNATDVSKLSLDELLVAVEELGTNTNAFFLGNHELEERRVRTEINLRRELQNAISAERIVPIDTLDVPPGGERQVVAVLTPNGSTRPHVQGVPRKQDSRIYLRLVDFDKDIVRASSFAGMVEADVEELPVRELMVRSTVCRSIMELGQPHINFGHMHRGTSKTRKIVVQNRSEWALRFCVRKSGSIASGDIRLSTGRYAVVPGYGKKEVEFIFSPSMSGQFQEKLVIENVGDRDNDQTVVLKANVRKLPHFTVEPAQIDFGDTRCLPHTHSQAQSILVSNVSQKARTFVVELQPEEPDFDRSIVEVVLDAARSEPGRSSLSKQEEEEVENLMQKIKIASRKGNSDKLKKYEKRLGELGVKPPAVSDADDVEMRTDKCNRAEAPTSSMGKTSPDPKENVFAPEAKTAQTESSPPSAKLKRTASAVTLTLPAGQNKRINVFLRPRREPFHLQDLPEGHQDFSASIRVHEQRNTDEVRSVRILANLDLYGLKGHEPSMSVEVHPPFPSQDAVTLGPTPQKTS